MYVCYSITIGVISLLQRLEKYNSFIIIAHQIELYLYCKISLHELSYKLIFYINVMGKYNLNTFAKARLTVLIFSFFLFINNFFRKIQGCFKIGKKLKTTLVPLIIYKSQTKHLYVQILV